MVETLRYDLRHAARSLMRAPGFTALVLLLVLGSGLAAVALRRE